MKVKITLIKNAKCKNCGREIPIVDKSIEYGMDSHKQCTEDMKSTGTEGRCFKDLNQGKNHK